MNPANWATLMADFMNLEMFTTRPRSIYDKNDVVNAGFRAIRVMDTPIFPDPFCPLGTMFCINSRYTGLYMSEFAPMTFSGFESQIPVGQISDIGVLISGRRSGLRQAVRRAGHRHHRRGLAECSGHRPAVI